ncbi:hypothetical protein [Nocardia ignorata]|uniref:hypothetical protein n=1 Tax=Nocardia ignorata TaxID=145285 RepID=UPI00082E40A2|nr:hypothetical protein [Nocardia ignorata]
MFVAVSTQTPAEAGRAAVPAVGRADEVMAGTEMVARGVVIAGRVDRQVDARPQRPVPARTTHPALG